MSLKASQFEMMANLDTVIGYAAFEFSKLENNGIFRNLESREPFIQEFNKKIQEYINNESTPVRIKLNLEVKFNQKKITEAANRLFDNFFNIGEEVDSDELGYESSDETFLSKPITFASQQISPIQKDQKPLMTTAVFA